ncbi:unnamed protein product [Ilex paraguariensis]|uniref:Uncharacterized protein n=1 Tax=Ilex paraguariensis TaxID=185542 RepID=A0ABC8RIE8_9AQUA
MCLPGRFKSADLFFVLRKILKAWKIELLECCCFYFLPGTISLSLHPRAGSVVLHSCLHFQELKERLISTDD